MSYDINTKQTYNFSADIVGQAAVKAIQALGGELMSGSNPAKGQIEANFNKKVKDRALLNRCQLRIKITPDQADSCTVLTKTYPVDPMGNKLAFGVRGDAAQVVSDTFISELKNLNGQLL